MSAAEQLPLRRHRKTAHAVIAGSRRELPGAKPIRAQILDALPHRLMGVLLPLDRFYRALIEPINYFVHRDRARRGIEEIVKHGVVNEVHIEATNICNAACKFCAYRVMKRPAGVMTLEDFRRYADQAVAAGVETFDLTAIVGDLSVIKTRPRPLIRAFRPEAEITTRPPSRRSDDVDHQRAAIRQSSRPNRVELQ